MIRESHKNVSFYHTSNDIEERIVVAKISELLKQSGVQTFAQRLFKFKDGTYTKLDYFVHSKMWPKLVGFFK